MFAPPTVTILIRTVQRCCCSGNILVDIVTALGVLSLAVQVEEPGQEIEGPMAILILGGLLTSMILNLLALRALALRYGKFAEREKLLDLQPRPAE